MVSQANCAKIFTFFCFNILYLGSAGYFLFKTYGIYGAKNLMEYDVGPSYNPSQNLRILIALYVILTAVIGFVAYFVDKPVLYATYGIMVLLCIPLHITCVVIGDKAQIEILQNKIKLHDLPNFYEIDEMAEFRAAIQKVQQEQSCCGYESYTDYYDSVNKKQDDKLIPDSCCGMWDETGVSFSRGQCSFDEYKDKKGCGDLLTNGYLDVLKKETIFGSVQGLLWIVVVIFSILQLVAAGLSFYILMVAKRNDGNTQIIYNANNY